MTLLHLDDQPFPEVRRLCGLSTRKILTPNSIQCRTTSRHGFVDAGLVVVEIERIDVLILLGRILRVGDGAVGQCGEPFRCSDDHGWSGAHCSARSSATSRSSSRARLTKYAKSSAVPSFRWIASWPPSAEPMAHREPTSSGPAIRCCWVPCDWPHRWGVDGRQVHHVETHSGDAWQVVYGGQKVPCTGLPSVSQPPVDRGKNSYHEPYRARRRSPHPVGAGLGD